MAEIQEYIDVQVLLKTAAIPPQGFGLELFLVDDSQIPPDTRFKLVTALSYEDEFASGTLPYEFAQVFFGQDLKADALMIGRWYESATRTFFYWGSGYEDDYLIWKAITDGEFAVIDNATPTPNRDELTGLDFSAVTSFEQILTYLNTVLAAIVTPNISGLNAAEFKIDGSGRVILEMPNTGASAAQVSITAVTTPVGTNLVPLMDATNGASVAGFDAEEPEEALAAISDIDDSYYNIAIRGGTDQQLEDLAVYVEGKEKLLDLVSNDPDAKNPLVTDDLGSILMDLNVKRTMIIYTEKDDEYPDAALAGRILPTAEGTVNWAWTLIKLVTQSGETNPLTIGERTALKDKRYNYIINIKGNVQMYDGITSGNEEKRIMLGRDWFVARIREDIYNAQVNNDLMAFDNETMTILESIIWDWAEEAIDRRILVNTVDRPFEVTLPDADDIPPSVRATHEFEDLEAFNGYLNSAINDYKIIGTWSL